EATRQLHAFGGILQHFQMVPVPDRGREIVAKNLFLFPAPDSGEKENASENSGRAQRRALFGGVHGKPQSALVLQSLCAGDDAMAIGITLDHRAGNGFGTDERMEGTKIVAQRGKRYLCPTGMGVGRLLPDDWSRGRSGGGGRVVGGIRHRYAQVFLS